MANARHSTPTGRPAHDVMVGDEHLGDALGQLRHSTRLLALGIIGLIHCPHEIEGFQHEQGRRDIDEDWRHDLEALAFDIVHDLEKILNAMEAGGQS